MDFYIWINRHIVEYQDKLKKVNLSKESYSNYCDLFSTYCTKCIYKYNDNPDLLKSLKFDIISKKIHLLKESKYIEYIEKHNECIC